MITVEVNHIKFNVEVVYKRYNRRIYLRVKDKILYITTPTKLSSFSIEDMIRRNFNTIVKLMNTTPKIEDQIHILGNSYRLEIKTASKNRIHIEEDALIVEITHPHKVGQLIVSFYNTILKNIVESYAKEILNQFHISKDIHFSYKNVKGYFGECFSKQGKIILASKLAKYEKKYILSVIYHECAHFKYQNHQKEFYDYLESFFPNYNKTQKELRSIKYNEVY
ncbi:MAG TPA: DUF45 domain-containing protein [Candidatus Pelethenecus sp.]|nr:DUF45 domain-containing protein [Candidatus Pelethenecus sp.]